MIKLDEDGLKCDLAETYHIYDYKQLPPTTVAVFSCGLRNDSRIKLKMADQQFSLETIMLAMISDRLSLLLWSKTKDGSKGRNRPTSLVNTLLKSHKQEKDELVFSSGEEFERVRSGILRKVGDS